MIKNTGTEEAQCLGKLVLLVTAHPDDEAMFFVPTIKTLLHAHINTRIHLLCLSSGNYEGLGQIRKKELRQACSFIGIHNLEIVEHEKLQDGMQNTWPLDLISSIVSKYVKEKGINMVLTFDDGGVSYHPNHIAVSKGVQQMYATSASDSIECYFLETTGLLRKFSGVIEPSVSWARLKIAAIFPFVFSHIGVWASKKKKEAKPESISENYVETKSEKGLLFSMFKDSFLQNKTSMLCMSWDCITAYKMMSIHASQFVWYRKLFIFFSRYAYINTWRSIESPSLRKIKEKEKKHN